MNYVADFGLGNLINQHKKKMINNVLFGTIIVVVSVIFMYFLGGEIINFKNLLAVFIFLLTIGYMQYSQVVPYGLIINNTVTELTIETDRIILKTSPFNVLFWIDKPSKEVVLNMSELKVKKVSYPVKSIFDLDNRVLKLTDRGNEVYVIVDYFDQQLKEQLLMSRLAD